MRDVDMVTLTIGGNDMGFAYFLEEVCVGNAASMTTSESVDDSGVPPEVGVALNELERRVRAVLGHLKDVTSRRVDRRRRGDHLRPRLSLPHPARVARRMRGTHR